jgi:hypothetical protein
VSELESDMRATVESIAADASRLTGIEEEKADLDADDPRLVELSVESDKLARRIVPKTAAERELAEQLVEKSGSGD